MMGQRLDGGDKELNIRVINTFYCRESYYSKESRGKKGISATGGWLGLKTGTMKAR